MENNTDKKRRGEPQEGSVPEKKAKRSEPEIAEAKTAQTPEPEKIGEEREPCSDSDELPDMQL